MALNHLHLHVRDRPRAEAFYEQWLGLRVARRGKRLTFMRDDAGFDLALMDDANATAMPAWFHFGFRQASADAVRALHRRMREAAVPAVDSLGDEAEMVWFRCADPDGYRIEVYWEAENAPLD